MTDKKTINEHVTSWKCPNCGSIQRVHSCSCSVCTEKKPANSNGQVNITIDSMTPNVVNLTNRGK